MENKIKKQIDGIKSNINEIYFNETIMTLTTAEEFEYFFSTLTTMYGYNSTSPANVTWFYNFFEHAPKISYPVVLKYVVNKKLYTGWTTLLLRNTENWSDEIFDLWLRSYDYMKLLYEIKNEKILNILNDDQIRKLVYYFKKNSGEMFIVDFEYIELFEENIDKFKFMETDLYKIFYEITNDEKYLSPEVRDIFIF